MPADSCFCAFSGEAGFSFYPSFTLAELVETPLSLGDLKSRRDSSFSINALISLRSSASDLSNPAPDYLEFSNS